MNLNFGGRYREGSEFFRKEGEEHMGGWMNEADCGKNTRGLFGGHHADLGRGCW